MAQSTPVGRKPGFRLRAEFETEAERLIGAERGRSPGEGVMRLRALIEISERLNTEALVDLAAALSLPAAERERIRSAQRSVQ